MCWTVVGTLVVYIIPFSVIPHSNFAIPSGIPETTDHPFLLIPNMRSYATDSPSDIPLRFRRRCLRECHSDDGSYPPISCKKQLDQRSPVQSESQIVMIMKMLTDGPLNFSCLGLMYQCSCAIRRDQCQTCSFGSHFGKMLRVARRDFRYSWVCYSERFAEYSYRNENRKVERRCGMAGKEGHSWFHDIVIVLVFGVVRNVCRSFF